MDTLVTRKGQVTVPISLRRKYGIKRGMRVTMEDSPAGILLKITPKIEDLAGIDADKLDVEKAFEILEKMRSKDRY